MGVFVYSLIKRLQGPRERAIINNIQNGVHIFEQKGVTIITVNKSASRAIDVLELLAKNQKPMTLTEIGRSLDLPKSSCFDIVYTLVERGVVEVDNEQLKTFRLGIKLFQLGAAVLEQTDLHSAARPLLARLAKETGETVYLAIEDKGEIVYLDKVESSEPIRSTLTVGSRNLMHVTGLGKALLATYKTEKVKKITGEKALPVRTPYSLKDYTALDEDLKAIRKRGYAIDDREGMEFLRCVAAPVRDYSGRAVAAVSIAALDSRLPFEKVPAYAAMVTDTALEISRRLGYSGGQLYTEDGGA